MTHSSYLHCTTRLKRGLTLYRDAGIFVDVGEGFVWTNKQEKGSQHILFEQDECF